MQGIRAAGVPRRAPTVDADPAPTRPSRGLGRWRIPVLTLAGLAALALVLAVAPTANAVQVDYKDMASAGPLTHVFIGADLSCQVRHVADGDNGEFYNKANVPSGCGHFLVLGPPGLAAPMYTPIEDGHCNYVDPTSGCNGNADGGAYGGVNTEAYTLIDQDMTGSGANGDPFTVVTLVGASATIQIRQTDRYWIGTEDYYTTVEILNSGGTPEQFIFYRAGDCYLGPPANADTGYGWITGDGIACTVTINNNPSSRYIRIASISTSAGVTMSYWEGHYQQLWSLIAAKEPLPNQCSCNTLMDNALAIAWQGTVPGGTVANPGTVYLNSSLAFRPGDPPNVLPEASILYAAGVATCSDSAVRFNGIISDSDGTINSIVWDFGDGSPISSEMNPVHTYEEADNYQVTLTVTDNKGGTRMAMASVPAVADTNCCPKMFPIQNQAIMEGEFVRFFLISEDFESDPMSYSVLGTLPPEASFDEDAGYFFWRTSTGHAGNYQFNIVGDDGQSHDPPCSISEAQADLGLVQVTVNIFVAKGPSRTTSDDKDNDGIDDYADNCPGVSNGSQFDSNIDGIGDACQEDPIIPDDEVGTLTAPPNVADSDGDLLEDVLDNCPGIANSSQQDSDLDRLGDVCDEDLDGDGVPQFMKGQPAKPFLLDNCPIVPNDQSDADGDGFGDACSPEALAHPTAIGSSPSGLANDGAGAGDPDFGLPLHYWLAGFAFLAGIVTVSLVLFVVGRKKQ